MARKRESNIEVPTIRLYWPGRRTEVERIALPFQVVETVNVSHEMLDWYFHGPSASGGP